MVRHAAAVAVAIVLSPSWLCAQSKTFTVSTESANIHKAPSTGSAVVGRAVQGAVLPVTRELGSWVKVSWPPAPDGAGYVHVSWGSIANRTTDASRTAGPPSARPAPQPSPSAAAVPADAPRSVDAPVAVRPVYVTPASHGLGLGGRMGSTPLGFGATARAWRRNRVGMQLDMSRYALTSLAVPARLTSTQIEPSVLYSLPDRVTDYLWLRPYVGSGATLRRESLRSVTPGGDAVSTHEFGLQAFGGGEVTFAGAPQFALSADVGYRWLRTPVAGFDLGGVGVSLLGHWYVK